MLLRIMNGDQTYHVSKTIILNMLSRKDVEQQRHQGEISIPRKKLFKNGSSIVGFSCDMYSTSKTLFPNMAEELAVGWVGGVSNDNELRSQ